MDCLIIIGCAGLADCPMPLLRHGVSAYDAECACESNHGLSWPSPSRLRRPAKMTSLPPNDAACTMMTDESRMFRVADEPIELTRRSDPPTAVLVRLHIHVTHRFVPRMTLIKRCLAVQVLEASKLHQET